MNRYTMAVLSAPIAVIAALIFWFVLDFIGINVMPFELYALGLLFLAFMVAMSTYKENSGR